MRNLTVLTATAFLAVGLAACGDKTQKQNTATTQPNETVVDNTPVAEPETQAPIIEEDMMSKRYSLVNASGYEIGKLLVRDTDKGVIITIDATSLPEGERAIHIHETGSCDGPDFTSAGGHYNPTGMNHGKLAENGPHAGDMPNITVPATGVLKTSVRNPRVSLSNREGFAPLRDGNGSALIIHEGADDYKTQPTGAAGGRIACAVID